MRRIGRFILSTVWLALVCFLIAMMVRHFRHVATPDDSLDGKIAMLSEIKAILPACEPVSFVTNLADDESSQAAYYQTQFASSPRILSDDVDLNDNIIFYRAAAARDSDMHFLHHCDTLYQRSGDGFTLLLLHKIKNR